MSMMGDTTPAGPPFDRARPAIPTSRVGWQTIDNTEALRRPVVPPIVDELFPRGSNTASCIVGRNEARTIAQGRARARPRLVECMTNVMTPLLLARKVTAEAVRAERRRLSETLEDMPGSIGSWGWSDVDRRSLDPAFGSVHLAIDTDRVVERGRKAVGHARLRAMIAEVGRREATFGWWTLPLTWTQHAADRLLERSEAKHTPHAVIAARIAVTAGLLCAMASAARAFDPDLQVAIPCAGGLLIGSVDVGTTEIEQPSELNCFGFGQGRGFRRRRDVRGEWWSGIGAEPATWRALTFIGPRNMDGAALAYAAAFEEANVGRATAGVRMHAACGIATERSPPFAERVAAVARVDDQVAGRLVGMAFRTGVTTVRPECRLGHATVGAESRDPIASAFENAVGATRKRGVRASLNQVVARDDLTGFERAMREIGTTADEPDRLSMLLDGARDAWKPMGGG